MRCAPLVLIVGSALTATAVKFQDAPVSKVMSFAKANTHSSTAARVLSGRAQAKAALYSQPAKAKEIEAHTSQYLTRWQAFIFQKLLPDMDPGIAGFLPSVLTPVFMGRRAHLGIQGKILLDELVALKHPTFQGGFLQWAQRVTSYLIDMADIFEDAGFDKTADEIADAGNVSKTVAIAYEKIDVKNLLQDDQVDVLVEVLRSRGFDEAVRFLHRYKPVLHGSNTIAVHFKKLLDGLDVNELPKMIASLSDVVATGMETTSAGNVTRVTRIINLVGNGTQLLLDVVQPLLGDDAPTATAQDSFHKFTNALAQMYPHTATLIGDIMPFCAQAAGFVRDLVSDNRRGPEGQALAFRKLANNTGVFGVPAPVSAFYRDIAHMLETNTMDPDHYMPRAAQFINEGKLMNNITSQKYFGTVPELINGYMSLVCALDGVRDSATFCSGK